MEAQPTGEQEAALYSGRLETKVRELWGETALRENAAERQTGA